MATFDDIFAAAKLPEDSVEICLRGDLQRRHEDLERELAEARETDQQGSSLADGGHAHKIAVQIRELQQEMREHTHPFAFRALPHQRYRDLVEAHPPRKDNDTDAAFGANMAAWPIALIAACAIDPPMTEEQVGQLADRLSEGQIMAMFMCAAALNRGVTDVPKSVLASEILASGAQKSRRPERGASAGGGSSAGSLAG